MLVDDESDARELATVLLQMAGAEVIAVASAADALSAIERTKPDVVVSDVGMPDEDGYGLVSQLRARGHRMPAIALTAYGRAEDRERAFAAGFQLHVAKPADPGELTSMIMNLVGRLP
jgi:CheY-like chemotaxis protein